MFIRTPVVIQGRLELTEANLMHFKWEVTRTHTEPNVIHFKWGSRVNRHSQIIYDDLASLPFFFNSFWFTIVLLRQRERVTFLSAHV